MFKIKYLLYLLLYLIAYNSYSQGSTTCTAADGICAGGTGLTFDNNTTFPTAESGIDYGCLIDQPFPTWFFIKIQNPGNLDFEISQVNTSGSPIDVDFIAWGPFTAPSCGPSNLNSSTQVGCSYLPDTSEYFSLINAQAGQYYMLLITNYSMEAGQITLTQTNTTVPPTPGAGSTDCTAVCPLSISGGGVPVCAGGILTAIFDNSTSPTFQWYFNNVLIPGATTLNYTPTQSGTYSVVANSPGCVPNQSASTVVPDSTPVAINSPTNPLTACTGATFNLTANTAIILSGLNPANYDVNYHLTLNGAQNVDNSIPNPANFAGTNGQIIYISVQDFANGGCVTTSQFTLSFISCNLTATNTGPICTGGNFNLTCSNAGSGFSYSWTGPGSFTSSSQNPTNVPSPNGTPPFVYTVTAVNGSTTITATTTVVVNSSPTVTVNNATICSGSSAIITATPSPSGSYNYAWTVPSGVPAPGNTASFSASTAGNYSVVVSNSSTTCSSSSSSGTLTVTSRPMVTLNNSTICPGEIVTITAIPNIPSTYNYLWTVPTGVPAPGNVASFTTTTIGTYSVIITDTVTSCTSLATSCTVVLGPTGGDSVLICGPSTPTSVNFDWNNIPGITSFNYSYSIAGGPIVTGNITAPTNFTVPTPSNLPVTFTLSPIGSVCVPPKTLTCNCPNPTINAIADMVVCGSNVVNQINFNTADPYDTVEWTNDNPAIGLAASGTSNFLPSFTAVNVATTLVANITVTLIKYGCKGSPRTFKITVNPLPFASISGSAIKCSGTTSIINFNGSPNATVSYSINGGPVQTITLSATGNGSLTTSVLITDTTFSLVGVDLFGCIQSLTGSAIITINPLPTVSVNSETVCSGSNVVITATPGTTGTFSYAWTVPAGVTPPGNVASFSTNVSGTYSVIITNTATTCASSSASGIINVFSDPKVTVNSPTICNGDTAIIIATPSDNNSYSYTWTVPSGFSNPGNVASFSTNIQGNYTVFITNVTTNCVSSIVTSTVTINSIPDAIATPNVQTICSNQMTGIALSSNVPNTTFSWTVFQSGVTGASDGTGNLISQRLMTTAAVTGVVIYTIIPSSNGCLGNAITVTITVTPIPTVTSNVILDAVCSGETTNISLTSDLPGTTYTWNVVQTNAAGATSGTGSTIAQILTNATSTPGEVIYSIIPSVGNCSGLPITVRIIVNPIPNAIANPSTLVAICSGNTTNINLSSEVPGTTFNWTAIQNGVFGVSSGTGSTIAQTLTTVGTVSGTVVYTITPISNGCSGIPVQVTVNVNPVPEVFGTSNSVICSGDSTDISLSPNIVGTTFTWTVIQIGLTGATNNGSGSAIDDTLITTGSNIGQAIYSITPSYNGCSGLPITITVLVNPAPIAAIQDGIICVTQATGVTFQNYILDTHLTNNFYDFTWYFNGVVIADAANNSTYSAEEVGTYGVVVKNNVTGCVSPMVTAEVIAYFPGEILSITQTAAFSDNGTIVINIDGTGTYQYQIDDSPFQTSNTFSNLSAGLHTISVIDIYGCTNIGPVTVSLIGYPHFFTPNGDGRNDTWNVIGLGNNASKILIYDRYGKLIKQISSSGLGWDGTYNGILLPSSDYWFSIEYIENGINKIFKSHFTMKR